MGRFDRYFLAQLLASFGLFALILVLVYWVNGAVQLFDQLIADGQSAWVFLEFTTLSLPNMVRMTLPIAAFAGSLYVTNRLSEGSELTVAQATGTSPWRLARPFVVFGLFVTMMILVLTHVLVPASQHRLRLRQAEVAEMATARLLREGQFLSPTDGVTLYIRDITPAGELQDLFLADHRRAGDTLTYTAARAYLVRTDRGPQLVMVDGLIQSLRQPEQRLAVTSFTDLAYDIGGLVGGASAYSRSSRELATAELLWPTPEVLAETGKAAGDLVAEGHNRSAQALMALVGALIGFATLLVGGFSRFGVWRQVLAAIGLIVLVKLIESATTGLVLADPALWPLSYLPGLAGLMIGGALLSFAGRTRRVAAGPRAVAP